MGDDLLEENGDFLDQLRDELAAEPETAVVAPELPLWHRIKTRFSGFKRYRVWLVRGLVWAMVVVIASQLIFQWVTAVNQYDGGPLPLSSAIEQVEDDLLIPPPPPPVRP